MDVICHEDVSVNRQTVTLGAVSQHVFEEQAVFIVGEDWIAIVASQNDVLRYAFDEIAGKSGHGWILAY